MNTNYWTLSSYSPKEPDKDPGLQVVILMGGRFIDNNVLHDNLELTARCRHGLAGMGTEMDQRAVFPLLGVGDSATVVQRVT